MSDIDLVREGLGRQPGCPVTDCSACRARQERIDAGERLIAALMSARAALEPIAGGSPAVERALASLRAVLEAGS